MKGIINLLNDSFDSTILFPEEIKQQNNRV